MIYGYARVSTKGQERDGNGLEVQERELRNAGAEIIYRDSYTGTGKDRPELGKLLNVVSEGDTVVVMKMDRIARSIRHGLDIIDEFVSKGVILNIQNMGKFDNSASGQLLRAVMLAFAEFERNMIIERTLAGKRVAKESNPNYREGRPRKEVADFEKFFEKQKEGKASVAECCRELGISRSTWYNLVKKS